MEKYVFEALMQMGNGDEGFARHNRRFSNMVRNDYFTTLFEGWGIGSEGFGGGSVNHAWSGGGLTVAYRYVCGIRPMDVAYNKVGVLPLPSGLSWAKASVGHSDRPGNVGFRIQSERICVGYGVSERVRRGDRRSETGRARSEDQRDDRLEERQSVRNKVARFIKKQPSDLHLSFEVKGGAYKLIAVR